jgi:FAD/FMN-containing dehydrogenase
MNVPTPRFRFAGPVHLPGDAGYDTHRRALNPAVDSRPDVVVEAAGPGDVRKAVTVAGDYRLPIAVQSTGHGTHVAATGGILVKTGAMASVLVDPDRRIARVGPGARWSAVLAAARPFGLAPLSGSAPSVGVTGYTLGGGLGWLGRRHGFAADSVVRAEVVTADGRSLVASADRNADLFWALRGGGGSFGVVTSLEFRLHEVPTVYAGMAYFDADRAAEVLPRYRTWAEGAPDAMSTAALLRRMPDADDVPAPVRGRRVLVLKAMYAGPADEARRLLRPLLAVAGPALHDDMRPMAYADAAMGGTAVRYFDQFATLPDAALDAIVAAHARDDAAMSTVEIRHWGGALGRTGPRTGPAAHRDAHFSVIVDGVDEALAARLRPHGMGSAFLNFLADTGRTEAAFTARAYAGLRAVKAAYDPDGVFRAGHAIVPATATAAAAPAPARVG